MLSSAGRYSKISRRIWNDERFRRLSKPQPCGQSLFFRLLAGPELTNIPGLFQAWESGLAESLGWQLKPFRESFGELSRERLALADWDVGLVWIPKAIFHNEPANANIVKSWRTAWAELPECELKCLAHQGLLEWATGKSESFAESFLEACPNHSVNHSLNGSGDGSVDGSGNHCPNDPPNQNQIQKQNQNINQTIPKPSKRATPKFGMTADWLPSDARLEAIESKTGINREILLRQVPEFRLYWLPGGGGNQRSNIVKRACDWDTTFSNRVDQLVSWGKLTITIQAPSADSSSPSSQKPIQGPPPNPGMEWHKDGYYYWPAQPKKSAPQAEQGRAP